KKDAKYDTTAHWDRQYPSVWVTDGGGGTFSGIWSPSGYAQAGFYVSNTKTPGRVYELSAEHHVRAEIVLDGVENWEFLAPQTEEEVRDGMDAVSLEIRNSKNVLFANYHGYRVTRSIKPMPAAVTITNSSDIRFRNVHVNGESGFATCDENGCATYLRASKYPYENAIRDVTNKIDVREREFAVLDYTGKQKSAPPALGKVDKLETGFYSIAGAAVDAAGKVYFADRHWRRIYSWSAADGLVVVRDAPLDPVNLAIDDSGNVMVLSAFGQHGSVYAFKPGTPGTEVTMIEPTPLGKRANAKVAIPANFWQNAEFKDQLNPATYEFTTLAEMFARDVALPKAREYVSPDGSLSLPAYRVLHQGPLDHQGYRWSDALQTHGFVSARVGERVVFTNGSENLTFSGLLGAGGAITGLKQVADRGGESAAVDAAGNVYVANGQVFVYGPDGKQTGRIDVPERPLQLVFGGPDKRTLFILTHHSLYSTRI
ncbi:MAG TPA: SMP-30/gluconolactonase/LRE family protein, partial [Pseudoduganella sp.]